MFCITPSAAAQLSAADLAAKLSAAMVDGNSATRLRMTIKPAAGREKSIIQVQIKARRTAGKSDFVYQVLWPKDRKNESFLLHQVRGQAPSGAVFVPPKSISALNKAQMGDPVFGGDLAYQDVIENFFAWKNQRLAGNETIDRVDCLILESKPGSKDSTPYSKVRSWIDPRKMVALRVEKYDASGRLARRFDTTRVVKTDRGHNVPASLVVRRPDAGTETEIEGSRIRYDVKYSDKDFTTSAMTDFKIRR